MKKNRIWPILFGFYSLLMLWLLFDRAGYVEGIPYWEQVRSNLNLIPFRTLRLFSGLLTDHRPHYVRAAVINLAGNVVMFIPLGYLIPKVFPKIRTLLPVLATVALIITMVEILQLLTLLGSCDIDDLILNLLGAGLGYGIYKAAK